MIVVVEVFMNNILFCSEMIPAVAKLGLATFCDVFCENGYFHAAFTEQVSRFMCIFHLYT